MSFIYKAAWKCQQKELQSNANSTGMDKTSIETLSSNLIKIHVGNTSKCPHILLTVMHDHYF